MKNTFDFKKFYQSLDTVGKDSFAKNAGTSADYIRVHLIHKTRMPGKSLMRNLANASGGKFTYADMVDFFYGSPE